MKECELIKGGHSFRLLVEKIIIIIIIIIIILIILIITEQRQDRITSSNSGYLYHPLPNLHITTTTAFLYSPTQFCPADQKAKSLWVRKLH